MEIKLSTDSILTVKISNSEPVELADFAKSMMSLANDYQARHTANPKQPAKLYIKEIRSGSIIAELAPIASIAAPLLIEHYDQIQNYAEHLHRLIGWLLGKEEKPDTVNTRELNNVSHLVAPVAADKGANINIGAINASGGSIVNININHYEANALQNNAKRELQKIQAQDQTVEMGDYTQVIMYWAQAAPEKYTDQAVIENIWYKPVKIVMPDEIKKEMLLDEPYPFSKGFLIDVNVQTIQGRPKLYKVLRYYGAVERHDNDDDDLAE